MRLEQLLTNGTQRRGEISRGSACPFFSKQVHLALFSALLLQWLSLSPVNAQSEALGAEPPEICSIIEVVAHANSLPVGFFTRLIWMESSFRPEAVGPRTRGGRRALGIAQFMPETAEERGLAAPFDPSKALPKSGEFLAELRKRFGNLGLAAAAYNAGPQRVQDFLTGARNLPAETRKYVLAVTGRPVEEWQRRAEEPSSLGDQDSSEPDATCLAIEKSLHINRSTTILSAVVGPRWCSHVRHPDKSVCGSIHETANVKQPLAEISKVRAKISKVRFGGRRSAAEN
jgi:hypothetical protein